MLGETIDSWCCIIFFFILWCWHCSLLVTFLIVFFFSRTIPKQCIRWSHKTAIVLVSKLSICDAIINFLCFPHSASLPLATISFIVNDDIISPALCWRRTATSRKLRKLRESAWQAIADCCGDELKSVRGSTQI